MRYAKVYPMFKRKFLAFVPCRPAFCGFTNFYTTFFGMCRSFLVKSYMFRIRHYLKILNSVVLSVVINVMNYFRAVKDSTKMFFHYKAVFFNVSLLVRKWMAWRINTYITSFNFSTALPPMMFFSHPRKTHIEPRFSASSYSGIARRFPFHKFEHAWSGAKLLFFVDGAKNIFTSYADRGKHTFTSIKKAAFGLLIRKRLSFQTLLTADFRQKKFVPLLAGSIISVFIFSSIGLCADDPRYVYVLQDNSGGLSDQVSEFIVPAKQAITANNVRINDQYGSIVKRVATLLYGSAGSFTINGMHRYYKADGTKYLVVAGSTYLYYGNDDTGVFTSLKDNFTDGKRFQFITYKDNMIACNGTDRCVKWDGIANQTSNTDGHKTANNLLAEAGAPFAELDDGSGGNDLDASSWYQYKIAWYDGTTYKFSSARSNPILTGSSVQNIRLTDIPLGVSGTTQRIIYRTVGDASRTAVLADTSYYRVATISDNTTQTYSDAITDATILADSAPTYATASAGTNVTMPIGKYIHIHKDRGAVSGISTARSDVAFSDVTNPQYWNPSHVFSVRPDDGDEVTFLKDQLGILTVGKTNTINKIYTEGTITGWTISSPFSFIGCPAPYSADNTPDGIVYLARGGLYVFSGQQSQLISDEVTGTIEDVNETNYANVVGKYFKQEYSMAYASKESGVSTNNRVLIYDTTRRAYVIDTKAINSYAAFNAGSDFGVLYEGSAATDGKVYAQENNPAILLKRLQSEFTLGTYDDTISSGTSEESPAIELGWDLTWDASSDTWDSRTTQIWDRPDTDGTWTSPCYEVNAQQYVSLFWNEILNGGNVTWAVRSGSSNANCLAASWSSEFTNPNGSDLTALTASNFIQLRASLSTPDIALSPQLYTTDGFLFKMLYRKTGTAGETSILSEWRTGYLDFQQPTMKKSLDRIKVYYEGTAGTITINYIDVQKRSDRSFTIDLSVNPTTDSTDAYFGDSVNKVFTHIPVGNSSDSPYPVSEAFQFYISEPGATQWKIKRIELTYSSTGEMYLYD